MIRRALPLALPLLLVAAEARGEFRYLLHLDVGEQYNSSVYGGLLTPGSAAAPPHWDFITELTPGVRLYHSTARGLLRARYSFLFQLYSRTIDSAATTAGQPLLGYANNLIVDYVYLLSDRTAVRLTNRFAQGTENTMMQGTGSPLLQQAFLTTGTRYLTDGFVGELERLLAPQWRTTPRLTASVYRAYDVPAPPPTAPTAAALTPSTMVQLGAGNRLEWMLTHDLLSLNTGVALIRDDRDPAGPTAPSLPTMTTYLVELGPAWRHSFNDTWDATLGAGIYYRYRQAWDTTARAITPSAGLGPSGEAAIRYRRGREVRANPDYGAQLAYVHSYDLLADLIGGSSAQVDAVTLSGEYMGVDWRFELAASFRYIRTEPRTIVAATPATATKVGRVDAVASYLLRAGISLELAYRLELVRDRLSIDPATTTATPNSYDRHMVTLGMSLVWPPPPVQDIRLTRRESAYEPIFNLSAGGRAQMEETPEVRGDPVEQRRRRERGDVDQNRPPQRRGDGRELFDTEQPADGAGGGASEGGS